MCVCLSSERDWRVRSATSVRTVPDRAWRLQRLAFVLLGGDGKLFVGVALLYVQ